jgi:hypothetical protein
MKYLLDRLTEPSTWRGLVALLTVFGAKLQPEAADSIVTAGASVYAAIQILRKERNGKNP